MQNVKKTIKRLLPEGVTDPILNFYHLLQAVAANLIYRFPAHGAQVIMVTGTNGKTTTAAHIAQMLAASGKRVGAITTAFYSYGDGKLVPNDRNRTVDDIFRLQKMLAAMRDKKCEYLVIEVTSHALVQNRVWGIPCDVAVMTNLTQDHLDYHKTMENYAAAKGRLFARRPRIIVLNRDDGWFDFFNKYEAGERKVSYGTNQDANCRISDVSLHKDGSDIKLVFDAAQEITIHTNLPGKFNVYNAAAAATTGYYLQLEPGQVSKGIKALPHVPGRLERVDIGQPFEVIVDYAHTPDALENVLGTLRNLTSGKLLIVFGATGDRDRTKRPVMGAIAARLADRIFVTDEESYSEDPAAIRQAIIEGIKETKTKAKTSEIPDRREAILAAVSEAQKGDVVLLAGMGHELFRNMGAEKIPWNDAAVARECLREVAGRR